MRILNVLVDFAPRKGFVWEIVFGFSLFPSCRTL
jgi:hypothetical protein